MSEPAERTAPTEPRLRLTDSARHLVRQVAVAVYVYIAFAILARFLPRSVLLDFSAELLLTFSGAALLALVVEGPLLGSALVGFFVAGFEVAILLVEGVGRGHLGRFLLAQAGPLAALVGAGVGGAALARRVSRRRAKTP